MAHVNERLKKAAASPLGQAAEILIYIAMLAAICILFTGNGEFIYEAF